MRPIIECHPLCSLSPSPTFPPVKCTGGGPIHLGIILVTIIEISLTMVHLGIILVTIIEISLTMVGPFILALF